MRRAETKSGCDMNWVAMSLEGLCLCRDAAALGLHPGRWGSELSEFDCLTAQFAYVVSEETEEIISSIVEWLRQRSMDSRREPKGLKVRARAGW